MPPAAAPQILPPRPAAARYDALDALRGICALAVCLFHFRVVSPVAHWPLVRGSWLFVDFFFVLSGFVIAANYRDRLAGGMPVRDFAILRLGRVYPLHAVMLALFVAVEAAGLALASKGLMQRPPFDGHHSVAAIFTNLALLQSVGLHDGLTWNHPSWSIAAEVWTYLLFATAARYSGSALDRWLAAAAIAAALFLASRADGGINVTHDWGVVRCIYGFAIGALIVRWRPVPARRPGWTATLAETAAVAGVAAFVSLAAPLGLTIAAPLVFATAVLVFARQGGAVSALLVTRPFLWLGLISYSIYMVHIFVQARLDDVLKFAGPMLGVRMVTPAPSGRPGIMLVGADPVQGTLFTIVMLALVVAAAALAWRLVEMPGQRWARRVVARRGTPHR